MGSRDFDYGVQISERHWLRRFLIGGVALCIFGALLALMLPGPNGGPPSPQAECRNNLRNIILALHTYHQQFGSFPPTYTVGSEGKPLHSWRTLLLPYLDLQPLYERLHLDEPWDSPHNRAITNTLEIWDVFVCPSDESQATRPNQTNFLAVVGPETMWQDGETRTMDDVIDDTAQTILLIEVAGSGIDFFEPRDLNFHEMSFSINDPHRPSPSSMHRSQAIWPWAGKPIINVGFADGSVRPLPESISPGKLKALLTINGGEATEGL